MTRGGVLSDAAWARIEPLLPPEKGLMGRPSRPHRPVVEGMIYRTRTGVPWRDLPAEFGARQTVHRRFQRWSTDGTLDCVLAELLSDADAAGELVVGGVGGLHDRPCAPARDLRREVGRGAVVAHRGRYRMTRILRSAGTNRTITASGVPVAA